MDIQQVQERLSSIKSDIDELASEPERVRLITVTKKFDVETIRALQSLGMQDFGENYSQELEAKASEIEDAVWHFVGGLQRNKVKKISDVVSVWHSVTSVKLIDAIATRTNSAEIFIQVNLTREPQKSGCEPTEITGLAEHARSQGLSVLGLMVMGPTGGDSPMPVFEAAQNLTKDLGFERLSMGMSGDYKLALSCGATDLRLGEAILGPRVSS